LISPETRRLILPPILAGLNWLTHCAQLSGVHPAKQSGTIRNFRKVVALAHRWWLTDGAAERCGELLASGKKPPLMLYLIWSDYRAHPRVHDAAARLLFEGREKLPVEGSAAV
jgi:hypothetical protein